MLAITCPGQGSQTPGMLSPWLEDLALAELLAAWSEVVELDLTAHGTTSDADTIRDTTIAQPLIVAASLLSLHALASRIPDFRADVVAGHSVGEFTAIAAAGVVTESQALSLVAVRGREMAKAAAVTATGMSAVVGGQPDEVTEAILKHGLTPANVNSKGQVVAAGTLEQLAALAADAPARTRVIPLQVAGAFHTEHMAPAIGPLNEAAAAIAPDDPEITLLSNRDGQPVDSGTDALDKIVAQVANPVRWDLCQETFAAQGVTTFIELAPGGVLTGLAKRSLPGVASVALKTPDDLDAAAQLITATAEQE